MKYLSYRLFDEDKTIEKLTKLEFITLQEKVYNCLLLFFNNLTNKQTIE